MRATYPFRYRNKDFQLVLSDDGTLALWLDGVLRKERRASAREPQYVWTNVELQWEEHHYVEARYWASRDRLCVTVNGDVVYEGGLVAKVEG